VGAVESRSPLRRYVVGLDALGTVAAQAVLPRGVIDAAMRLASGL
jgi:hypothetical protein